MDHPDILWKIHWTKKWLTTNTGLSMYGHYHARDFSVLIAYALSHMLSYLVGLKVLHLTQAFIYIPPVLVPAATARVRLCGCACSTGCSPVAFAISIQAPRLYNRFHTHLY